MDWAEAYRMQAKADYRLFEHLNESRCWPPCQQLYCLQMAGEKWAKSRLCGTGNKPPKHSHATLVKALQGLGRDSGMAKTLGYGTTQQFAQAVRSILEQARVLQELAPVGGADTRPNHEYPWCDTSTREIVCPADYKYPGVHPSERNMVSLGKLLKQLLDGA